MARAKSFTRWLIAITLVIICYLALLLPVAVDDDGILISRAALTGSSTAVANKNIDTTIRMNDRALEDVSPVQRLGPIKRAMDDDDWDTLVCVGELQTEFSDKPSYAAAKALADQRAPAWAHKMSTTWENPNYQATYGWSTSEEGSTIKNLHITRMRQMLEHYHLSTDPAEWVMRTARHRTAWKDTAGQEHAASGAFFSYVVNKRTTRSTMIWTAMFSPQHMMDRSHLNTIEPPLKFASDVYYLQYYRYWAVDRSHDGANPAGGSPIPPPKTIVIRSIHEETIVSYFREIKSREGDRSSRVGGKRWPGDRFVRDDEEFNVILASPMGQGITWFLTQHKHIWGAKSIGRIRVWASSNSEDDFNMLFEIIDPPDPESDGDEAAGPEQPAERRRGLARRQATTVSTNVVSRSTGRAGAGNRRLRRRVNRVHESLQRRDVEDEEWNGWICFGRAMYELMGAPDEAAAEAITQKIPLLEKWRGRTSTQWRNPKALAQYGWTITRTHLANLDDINVDQSIQDSGLPVDYNDDWHHLNTKHMGNWKDDGSAGATDKDHKPTNGEFQVYYLEDEDNPTMILSLTSSPRYILKMRRSNELPPPLQLMSDVVFLTYYDFWQKITKAPKVQPNGGSKVPPPRYIFIKDIQEETTRDVILPEIGRRGSYFMGQLPNARPDKPTYFGDWPGVTLTPDQDDFYTMLYTAHGRGVSAFLFNHKQELGARRIKSVRVWFSDEHESYYARFEMEDSPHLKSKPAKARRSIGMSTSGDGAAFDFTLSRHDSFQLDTREVLDHDVRRPLRHSLPGVAVVKQVVKRRQRRGRHNRLNRRSLRGLRRQTRLRHLGAQVPPHDNDLPVLTPVEVAELKCTGELMLQMLSSMDEVVMEPIIAYRRLVRWRGRSTSPWTDYDALPGHGWGDEGQDEFVGSDPFMQPFHAILDETDTPNDANSRWVESTIYHNNIYFDSQGVQQEPSTDAYYESVFNRDANHPVLIVSGQFSPQAMDRRVGLIREPPALSRWSDVMFLMYYDHWKEWDPNYMQDNDGRIPCPRFIIISHILNVETRRVFEAINRAAGQDTQRIPMWPGRVYSPISNIFQALLGLPQSRGVSLFLFQHKEFFGLKTVASIRWTTKNANDDTHNLVFEIVDVPGLGLPPLTPKTRDLPLRGPDPVVAVSQEEDATSEAEESEDDGPLGQPQHRQRPPQIS